MSVQLSSGLSGQVNRIVKRSHCCLLAISVGLVFPGCGPAEPKEISAATSGYMPGKESDAKESKGTKTASGDRSDENVAAAANSAASGGVSQLPIAPSVPVFQPGKVDPKIASKLYMTLQLGDLNGPKPLMEFLIKSSRAFLELVSDSRKKDMQLPRELLLERGMALSRMKLEAAKRLETLAASEDEKTAASLGVLEAYSQMASFKDVAAMDNLRELASKEMSSDIARVAQQAKAVAVGLLVADFGEGVVKADELTGLANKILSDGSVLTGSNLNSMMQAVDVLAKRSENDASLSLAQKVEVAFRDNPENQLAMEAWRLHASLIKETMDVAALAQSDSKEDEDPAAAKAKVAALMSKIPSPWTAFFLAKTAVEIEYSGRAAVAKELIDVAATQINNLKDPDAKAELERNCAQFYSRSAVVNKPLDLSELVDLAGQPVDLQRYKGKVVLVDFWATWCGPCKAEIPNIEAMYKSYNKDGFEVIGVNLDNERTQLDAFLASNKLVWSTYVSSRSDATAFDTPIAKKIGISAIPFIAIVGKDGNVAAVHVRGRKLEAKIQELLAKE